MYVCMYVCYVCMLCMYVCMYVYKPARGKANSEACLLHVHMCVCVLYIYMYMYIYRLGVRLTARPASFMNSGSTATMSSMLLQTKQSAYVVEAKP